MALDDNNSTPFTMPVQPMYGGYGNNGGFFGGDWAWILLLLLIGGNGWGFGGGFGMGGMMPWMMGAGMGGFGGWEFPWLWAGQNNINDNVNSGFRDQQLQSSISGLQNSVTTGFGDVQLGIAGVNQNICQTGNGIVNAINGGFNSAEIAANGRQMANMQQAFAAQTATAQGFNGVQAALADVKFTEATEACATRTASATNARDIIDAQTRGTQAILDKLCALELDNVKAQLAQAQRDNVALQNAVNMSAMRESQTAQTAQILAGQNAEVDALYNRLNNCPVPSTPVYGRTPIFTCNNGGCGCNSGFAA